MGFLCAQIAHAAGESAPRCLPDHTNAIVLGVPNIFGLLNFSEYLAKNYIVHAVITETDEPYAGQETAIGCYYPDKNRIKKYFRDLPLLSSCYHTFPGLTGLAACLSGLEPTGNATITGKGISNNPGLEPTLPTIKPHTGL